MGLAAAMDAADEADAERRRLEEAAQAERAAEVPPPDPPCRCIPIQPVDRAPEGRPPCG